MPPGRAHAQLRTNQGREEQQRHPTYILGEIDQDRSRAAADGNLKGLVNAAGEVGNVLHENVPLGARPRDADHVCLLERVASHQRRRHLRERGRGRGVRLSV